MLIAGSVGHGAVPNDVSSPQVRGVLPLVLPSFHFGLQVGRTFRSLCQQPK